MKKVLLGTTAIIGASFLPGQAFAADPIQLDVGGGATWAFGGLLADSGRIGRRSDTADETRTTFIEQSVEVQFTGSTSLDNGLTVGVRVEYEADGGNARDDENYVFVSGGFGQFRIGDDDDAADHMSVKGAPCAGIFCADGGTFALTAADSVGGSVDDAGIDISSTAEISGDAAKLVYYTPRMAGFRLVASYAPDSDEGPRDTSDGFSRDAAVNDVWGIGADFNGDVGPVALRVAGALTAGNNTGGEDLLGTFAAVRVGFAGFQVGGGYGYRWAATDNQAWSVGASYGAGPVSVGMQYATAKDNTTAAGGNVETYRQGMWSLDGTYTMGPGISVSAGLNYTDVDTQAGLASDNDYDSVGIGMGIGVGF